MNVADILEQRRVIAEAMIEHGVGERQATRYAQELVSRGYGSLVDVARLKLSEAEKWYGIGPKALDAFVLLGAVDDRKPDPLTKNGKIFLLSEMVRRMAHDMRGFGALDLADSYERGLDDILAGIAQED